ncbi:solute carrier family 22 member 16 [Sorex araneus]|uniref:solute carrier family 22 member 16 n=1 Tax=Sorex araneus TaxID=42254 RepID=UPI002433F9B9|nr:solute carrier family 22 member 16 [Sorex araneus]
MAEIAEVAERWGRERPESKLGGARTPRSSVPSAFPERPGQLRQSQARFGSWLSPYGDFPSWDPGDQQQSGAEQAASDPGPTAPRDSRRTSIPDAPKDVPRTPNVELIFDHVGHFGRFQKVLYFICAFQNTSCGIHLLASVFIVSTPSRFICKPPGNVSRILFQNTSGDILQNIFSQTRDDFIIVQLQNGEIWELSNCGRVHRSDLELNISFSRRDAKNSLACPNGYFYNQSKFSLVTEWNLVCDRKHLALMIQPIFICGAMVGSMIFGYLADRLGRRPILWPTSIAMILFGILTAFSVDIISFFIVYFFLAMVTGGFIIVVFIYVVEIIGMKYRTTAAIFLHSSFALGIMIVALVGYLAKTLWVYQMILTLVTSPFILCCWILPETPFWLLSEGKYKEAQEVVDKIAKWNGKPSCQLSEVFLQDLNNTIDYSFTKKKTHSILYMFYGWNVGLMTTVTWLIWFTASLGFYSFSLLSLSLSKNKYLFLFLTGIMEILAYVLVALGIRTMGAKKLMFLLLWLNSVACGILVIPMGNYYTKMAIVWAAKMSISAVFNLIFIHTANLYPTTIRALALGSGTMVSRLGSLVAPFYDIISNFWLSIPQFLVMVLALLSGVLSLVLPETFNMPLANTWEDSFALKKEQKTSSKDFLPPTSNPLSEERDNQLEHPGAHE